MSDGPSVRPSVYRPPSVDMSRSREREREIEEMEQFLMRTCAMRALPERPHCFCGLFVQLQITFFSHLGGVRLPQRFAGVSNGRISKRFDPSGVVCVGQEEEDGPADIAHDPFP